MDAERFKELGEWARAGKNGSGRVVTVEDLLPPSTTATLDGRPVANTAKAMRRIRATVEADGTVVADEFATHLEVRALIEAGAKDKRDALDRYLDQFIHEYLFADLETLSKAGPEDPTAAGHVGYPLFMACAAGIELLGLLLSTTPYTAKSSKGRNSPNQNFDRYWKDWLYPKKPACKVGVAVYSLVRNGVAHTFAAKAPTIAKRGPHLVNENGVARINVVSLAADLQRTYWEKFVPSLKGNMRRSIRDRFKEMMALDKSRVKEHSKALAKLPPPPAVTAIGPSALSGLNDGTTDTTGKLDIYVKFEGSLTSSYAPPVGPGASTGHFATSSSYEPFKK